MWTTKELHEKYVSIIVKSSLHVPRRTSSRSLIVIAQVANQVSMSSGQEAINGAQINDALLAQAVFATRHGALFASAATGITCAKNVPTSLKILKVIVVGLVGFYHSS